MFVTVRRPLGECRLTEFTFGQTRVADVQIALGQQGFHYACRQLQPISGGLLTFVSFEIPSRRDAVYTFVAEYSRDLADRGLVDLENVDLAEAVVVGAIVSRPDYPEDFWCDEVALSCRRSSWSEGGKPGVVQRYAERIPKLRQGCRRARSGSGL